MERFGQCVRNIYQSGEEYLVTWRSPTVESEGWRGQRGRPSGGALSLGSVSRPVPTRLWAVGLLAVLAAIVAVLASTQPARACGGFFCTTTPVDQNAERIIFTQNGDGTVSAYVQIEYTGSAPDFSWILPLPEAIDAEAVQVPEDAMAAFTELEVATDPVIMAPPVPSCVPPPVELMIAMGQAVEVFASGEVGPYSFDVVGSEDPDALVTWLRENDYRVTEAMEPLIDVYVDEQFVFLAMKLRPDKGAQDVEPVKVTYPSEHPMIPLRLTAVAANPNMAVMVWIYAEHQAVPMNYAKMTIENDELSFWVDGRGNRGNNYRLLIGEKADEHGGQAFITEYASPTSELRVTHPLLRELSRRFSYVTRLNTVISPAEMTVDPVFDYDPRLKDVSNVRDLREMTGLYECEREERANSPVARLQSFSESVFEASDEDAVSEDGGETLSVGTLVAGVVFGVVGVLVLAGAVYLGVRIGRRGKE